MSDITKNQQNTFVNGKKASGKKAVWSNADDLILLTVLKEHKSAGFQTDNEARRRQVKCVKKDFKAVKSICEKSGFGWDTERCLATATAEVWEDLIKSKPSLKCWQTKRFPLYDNILNLIKDQVATGATAFFPGVLQPGNDLVDDDTEAKLSPAWKTRTISHLEEDDELSDNKMIDAFKLIHRDTSIADVYLTITSVKCCTHFIQAEINAADRI
ncbi:hypothetical protein F5050DRAFT_1715539 [Lentinula boryana]|uniref:Myb/SANT-like domain-containing protein n=1 Tax=Lentinula boryana TaxID=40481 RepID=A0ABQ8Q0B6_9AGAR|nr:hypothetical protein F5050DRAFT_1715539 [Lentinula boryana]